MRHLIAVATVAAALALAACSTAASITGGRTSSLAAAVASCHAQYEAWKHGAHASAQASFEASLRVMHAAGQARDVAKMISSLERVGRAAERLEAIPPPRCADPHRYYRQGNTLIAAAAGIANAIGGRVGLANAEAQIKALPAIQAKLRAELNRTVGVKR